MAEPEKTVSERRDVMEEFLALLSNDQSAAVRIFAAKTLLGAQRGGWNTAQWLRSGVSMGEGCVIGHHVVITQPHLVKLGNRVRIDPFTLVTGSLETGDNVQICAGAVLGGRAGIRLGDWTHVGYHSRLFSASESYDGPVNDHWGRTDVEAAPIVFGDHAGVASNVTVMPGVVLPEGCKIGADSFVPKDAHADIGLTASYVARIGAYEPWSIWWGSPAVHRRYRDSGAILARVASPEFAR